MPTYEIETADGKIYEVELPEEAAPEISAPSYGRMEGIGAQSGISTQDLFPSTARAVQQFREHPVNFRIGGGLPDIGMGAVSDLGRLATAPIQAGITMAERAGTSQPVGLPEAIRRTLQGQLPASREEATMRALTETLPFLLVAGTQPARQVGHGVAQAAETLTLPQRQRLATVADVLAVPEGRLPKLTAGQRQVYFRERAAQIRQQTAATRLQLKQEQIALSKELGKAATTRSLDLRPQVPAYLSRQSSLYRQLADAELAPLANESIETTKLAAYVKQRFGKDPEALAEVSSRLGLTNEALEKTTVSPLLDELGRPVQQTVPTTRKIGELYLQAKEMGQQIPASVRESLRVYSRDEHFIDDSIDTLMGFLKDNGVDLKAANAHWRSWAPVRNQLVRETRPYNLAETQTQAFSRRLIKLAQGIDPDNAKYAETVAKGLGIDDLPGPLKSVVAKLDTNKKTQLALTLQQQESLGQLQALQFRVNQIADKTQRQMAVVKWIIAVLGGATGVGFSGHQIGQALRRR